MVQNGAELCFFHSPQAVRDVGPTHTQTPVQANYPKWHTHGYSVDIVQIDFTVHLFKWKVQYYLETQWNKHFFPAAQDVGVYTTNYESQEVYQSSVVV